MESSLSMQTLYCRVWVHAKTGAIKLMNCQGKTFQGKFKVPALGTVTFFFPSHLVCSEILNLCSTPFFYSLPTNLTPSKSCSSGAWQQRIFILLRCRKVTNSLNSGLNNNQQKDTAIFTKRFRGRA